MGAFDHRHETQSVGFLNIALGLPKFCEKVPLNSGPELSVVLNRPESVLANFLGHAKIFFVLITTVIHPTCAFCPVERVRLNITTCICIYIWNQRQI
jgi:hypothetical protein